MKVEGLRSPYQKLHGLYHLGRMLDKIRLHQAGQLPAEYHPNFGLSAGLDGYLCGFLGVEFAAVCDRVRQGGSDDEVAEWCFQHGLRPTKMQIRIWNEFARKLGWNDAAAKFVERVKSEDGLTHRTDVVTAFDLIELREGRDRKRAKFQKATRADKARFEGIFVIADDAIISVDSKQRIVLFNQGAEKVFGYAPAEVIGKSLDLLLPQRFAHALRGHIEAFAKSPEVSRAVGQGRELFGLRKDGYEFPAEASISKLDLGGDLIFTVILRDITERKRAAEALRASEHLARGQVEALKSALEALAMESAPDRLVEHLLRTLTEQFGAHSGSVWRRDEAKGMIGFEFAFEDGRIVTKADPRFAGMDLWLPMEDFWPWSEVFRTGKASVIEDIRTVRPFALRDRLLPLGIVTVLLIPMSVVGRLEGTIGLRFTQKRPFRSEEIELAQALANQAMLAMQLTRLSAESRESAVIAERNRMARDIHDTLAQGFTGVIMQLEATKGALAQNNLAEATDRVERAGDLARVGLGEARRSVMALRPRSLQDTSLCMALDDLFKRMTNGSGLQAEFHLEGDEPAMPAEWEEGLLRVAQESLTNTIKHAKAKNFRATLIIGANEIQFRLVDDGAGFELHVEHEGFGLVGMKERVDQMGGQFILRSMPGQGTEIQIILKKSARS